MDATLKLIKKMCVLNVHFYNNNGSQLVHNFLKWLPTNSYYTSVMYSFTHVRKKFHLGFQIFSNLSYLALLSELSYDFRRKHLEEKAVALLFLTSQLLSPLDQLVNESLQKENTT